MNRFSFKALLFLLPLASTNGNAQIVEDFQYEYYPVDIQANQEYHQATVEASPFKFHDATAIGLHQASFSWRWTAEKIDANGKCRPTHFILYHKTRINLPELTGAANNQQARQFHYYFELIKQHELEHYYIAKDYVRILEQRIINELGNDKHCSLIDDEIKRIVDAAMIELNQQQNEFDERDYKVAKIKEVENLLRQYH